MNCAFVKPIGFGGALVIAVHGGSSLAIERFWRHISESKCSSANGDEKAC